MQKKTLVVKVWKPDLYPHYTKGKRILDAEITLNGINIFLQKKIGLIIRTNT